MRYVVVTVPAVLHGTSEAKLACELIHVHYQSLRTPALQSQLTPLYTTAERGFKAACQVLIEAGANVDI